MKRNQPPQSKRRARQQERAAKETSYPAAPVQPAIEQSPPSPADRQAAAAGGRDFLRSASGVLLAAILIVCGGLVMLWISVRWTAVSWPSAIDVGLVPLWAAVATGFLFAAGVLTWCARRAAQAGNGKIARLCLLGTLIMSGFFTAWRCWEYRELYRDGFWRRSTEGPIHEAADLYYLQAVRTRLMQLFRDLEQRHVNQPDAFSDEDQQRLELVNSLQQNMVTWTENQVGHWLDDLQQRQEVMQLVAYQVHPLASQRESSTLAIQEEQRTLARQRSWFDVLNEYCRQKMDLLGQSSTQENIPTTSNATGSAQVDAPAAVTDASAEPEPFAELDNALQQKLSGLGLSDWLYAKWVIQDTSDLAMAGERFNQTAARLSAMAARAEFLDDETFWPGDGDAGLNRRHRWLRLPVCLPHGNAWAGSFFAMQGLLLGLLAFASAVTLMLLAARFDHKHLARWQHIAWWWSAVSGFGVILFLLFYIS